MTTCRILTQHNHHRYAILYYQKNKIHRKTSLDQFHDGKRLVKHSHVIPLSENEPGSLVCPRFTFIMYFFTTEFEALLRFLKSGSLDELSEIML